MIPRRDTPPRSPVPNIWQLQSKGDVDGLIEALRHTDAGTRRGAAAALRALGAWQAVPALQAALALENDWQVHAAITAALQYLDHDIHIEQLVKGRDVRGLAKMLNSSRIEDVLTACNALASLGDRMATESLVMVFKNALMPNKVRLAAAEALLKLESAPAVVTLLGALRREDWQVRRNAAAVLGQLQATWATEPLVKALGDDNQDVRRTAAAALRRIATPEALDAVKHFEEAPRTSEPEIEIVPQHQTDTARLEAIKPIAARLPMPPTPVPGPSFALPAPTTTDRARTPASATNANAEVPTMRPDVRGDARFKTDTMPLVPVETKKKTGRLPPLPDEAETPKQPVIKQLMESSNLAKTGRLPPLPEQIDTPEPPKASALDALLAADTRPTTIRQVMGTDVPATLKPPPPIPTTPTEIIEIVVKPSAESDSDFVARPELVITPPAATEAPIISAPEPEISAPETPISIDPPKPEKPEPPQDDKRESKVT